MIIEDNDELEGQEGQEPEVTLPEHPAGKTQSRQELIDSTLDEATGEASQEAVIDELASKDGELTLEDLKKLPGAEGLTDEQIQKQWQDAVAAEKGNAGDKGGETFKVPFPIYDKEGNKIDALEKISLRDLFEGKLQLGYQALGKEQRKTLAEAIRNASMGHWNEQKYNTTVEERNRVAQELATANQQIAKFSSERKVWDAALTSLAMGDIGPMTRIARALQAEATKVPGEIPGYVPIDQVNAERKEREDGQRYIDTTIVPAAKDIAKRYSADEKEVLGAIEFFLKKEPPQFLTEAKIQSILQYDVPNVFEQNGYSASGQTTQTGQSNDVEELKRTVAALQERIAENKNSQTQNAREKTKKAPPSGGGATPGAGDSMPSFKSRSQMKAWMQGDSDWAKA